MNEETYRRAIRRLLLMTFACLYATTVLGQTDDPAEDSLWSYRLAEIVVQESSAEPTTTRSSTHRRVPLAALAKQDAADVTTVLRRVPAAHVQTNSRGETLVYLRGAGERQTALFFDGALLNIPWDNRMDLSLVPMRMAALAPRLRTQLGISLDVSLMPQTGDKPRPDLMSAWAGSAALSYHVASAATVHAPLGRFVINPDLQPETSLLSELGARWYGSGTPAEVAAFLHRTYGTIDQRSVPIPGGEPARRQRIDLEGSRVLGIEVAGTARLHPAWRLEGHLTWMRPRGARRSYAHPLTRRHVLTIESAAPLA